MSSTEDVEAAEPGTSPERLAELVRERPDLWGTILKNPSCPATLREYMLAENPSLRKLEAERVARLQAAQPPSPQHPVAPVSGRLPQRPATTVNPSRQAPIALTSAPVRPVRSSGSGCVGSAMKMILSIVALLFFLSILSALLRACTAGNNLSSATDLQAPEGQTETDPGALREGWLLPAPDTATSYPLIDTPSKNISCELHEDFAACSIADRSYAENGQEDCVEDLFSVQISSDDPQLVCGQVFLGIEGDPVHEMSYGEVVTASPTSEYACKAEESGVSCWNQRTGKGFKIRSEGYALDPNPGW